MIKFSITRQSKNLFLISIFLAFIFSANLALAQTTTPTTTSNLTATSTPEQISEVATTTPLLIQQVRQAKELLKNVKLDYVLTPHYAINKKTKQKYVTKYTLDSKEIAVVVINPTSLEMLVVKGKQSGKNFVFKDKKVIMDNIGFNGVNTRFIISQPSGGTVLALKYLISPVESGTKKGITSALEPVVYTPYSKNLDQAGVAEFGQAYLDQLVEQAAQALLSIPSRFMPEQSVSEAIPQSLVKSVFYAEHLNEAVFLGESDLGTILKEYHLLLAANEGVTFNYSRSSAGALGLGQFMPKTYSLLAKKNSAAKLYSDFTKGMRDHLNAAKATYLLLDEYAGIVKRGIGEQFIPQDLFVYAAAAYNGGPTRVVKAVKLYGLDWQQNHLTELAEAKSNVTDQQALVNQLKAKLKKALAADKKTLTTKLNTAKNKLYSLDAEYKKINAGTLRRETVIYLQKVTNLKLLLP